MELKWLLSSAFVSNGLGHRFHEIIPLRSVVVRVANWKEVGEVPVFTEVNLWNSADYQYGNL
jgi:hypothetical protein